MLYNNNHSQGADLEYITVCMSMCLCVCTCIHAHVQLGHAYGTCTHPLTSVTLLSKASFRLLNGMLLSDIMPHKPNHSTHKLFPNHFFIHMQHNSSLSKIIFLSFICDQHLTTFLHGYLLTLYL